MKKIWFCIETGFALLALALVVLFCVCAFRSYSDGAAAWVQAVGSIAAIVAAWQISNNQYRRERRLSERRNMEDRLRKLDTVLAILRAIDSAAVIAALRKDPIIPGRSRITIQENFSAVIRFGDALKEVPLFDLEDANIVSRVVQASWLVERLRLRVGSGNLFPWMVDDQAVLKTAITEIEQAVRRLESEIAKYN